MILVSDIAHTWHMLSMSLTRADFDNIAVTNAVNPSTYGYHHGEHMPNAREP